jgi:hypothetical protein
MGTTSNVHVRDHKCKYVIWGEHLWHLQVDGKYAKKNSMVWVRERTIPTERPPLVNEVIANFLRIEGATWSAWRIPTAVFSVFQTGAAIFLSSSSSVALTRLSEPRSRHTVFFSGIAENRTRASGSVAKNFWPLDHRGGLESKITHVKSVWHERVERFSRSSFITTANFFEITVKNIDIVTGGTITISYWGFCGSFTLIIAHGLCSFDLFCLANISYERLGSPRLLISRGIVNLIPRISFWWFMLSVCNITAPPSFRGD